MKLKIINFDIKYEKKFFDLNIQWLNEYFFVEEYDKKILSNSNKFIINKGGEIFFAKLNNEIVGTIALMPAAKNNEFELTKMAVTKVQRNKGIGKILLERCIKEAKNKQIKKILIYSNRKLENAIYLYKKYGFKEIGLEKPSPYERADIKLELNAPFKSIKDPGNC